MKRFALLQILFYCLSAFSQTISVSNFRLLESDLTANTTGTMEVDQNGETAALIKVVTTQTGFTFDGGALGIVKTVQKPSEVWVYVPRGLKKITISHPQLGMLRDYYLNIPIEAARTYEMVLVTGSVQTVVSQDAGGQYLIMELTPKDAQVWIDDVETTTSSGLISKFLLYGEHSYRISSPLYESEAGKIVMGNNKKEMKISLKPAYNCLNISTTPENNANIYVDNGIEPLGKTPFITQKLPKGSHSIRAVMQGYESKTISFEANGDGSTQDLVINLEQIYANVTISAPNDCSIIINDEEKGMGTWSGKLIEGAYKIEAKKPSHHSTTRSLVVERGKDQSLTLNPPIPIYGKLNVNSKPIGATVKIAGKVVGKTPDIIDNVLIGNQELTVELNGYKSFKRNVNISEGKITELVCELEEKSINGKKTEIDFDKKVILKSSSDSVSYAGGMSVTNGLLGFLSEQMKVDTANNMNSFVKGFIEGVKISESEQGKAYRAGTQIATQLIERMIPEMEKDINGRYVINKELLYQGFIDALNKDEHIFKVEDAETFFKEHK